MRTESIQTTNAKVHRKQNNGKHPNRSKQYDAPVSTHNLPVVLPFFVPLLHFVTPSSAIVSRSFVTRAALPLILLRLRHPAANRPALTCATGRPTVYVCVCVCMCVCVCVCVCMYAC